MNTDESPRWRRRAPHALLLVALLLVACGKKGPLYLPDRPSAPAGGAAQPANPPAVSPVKE